MANGNDANVCWLVKCVVTAVKASTAVAGVSMN